MLSYCATSPRSSAPCACRRATVSLMSSTANITRCRPSVLGGGFSRTAPIAGGVRYSVSSSLLWPSGVRIIAMSLRTPSRPTVRSAKRPSTWPLPSNSMPSSVKNATAASRSSTTMATLSIRWMVMPAAYGSSTPGRRFDEPVGTRRFILGKILQALLTLAFVLVFNFFLFRVIPSDPLEQLLGPDAFEPPNIEQLTRDLGLDEPLPQQFLIYARNTLALEFGDSFSFQGQDVKQVISERIWPTLLLVATSTIASAAIGLLIGIHAGWRHGSRFDKGSQVLTLFVYAMPEFWFGILVLMAFAEGIGPFPSLFPAGGYSTPGTDITGLAHVGDVLNHLALPWFVLTVALMGQYALIMRNSLIGVMSDQFVVTARAKGVREKQILWGHVVPNALLPTFTIVLLSLGFVFGGAITVEYVFSYPGLGLLTVQAIDSKDFPLLQGLFLLFSAAVIIANLIADILYSQLDPRVRAG